MKKLQTEIQKMLSTSVLVSTKQKLQISRDLGKYSKDQLDVLYSFLSEAAKNQKTLLWQALKNNPKFEKEVEKAEVSGDETKSLSNLMGEIFMKNKENTINKNEAHELQNIEQELANI